MRVDFEISGGGTVHLLHPLTRAARVWVEEHLPPEQSGSAARWSSSTATSGRSSAARSGARLLVMVRYVRRPLPESSNEDFLAWRS